MGAGIGSMSCRTRDVGVNCGLYVDGVGSKNLADTFSIKIFALRHSGQRGM